MNVSATLTLLESSIRAEPRLDAPLLPVPRRRSVSIATSTAQAINGPRPTPCSQCRNARPPFER